MALPLLLAGPIVRRVEPRSVSVWVATSESCEVRLGVWPGPVTAGTGPGVFQPGGEAAAGNQATVRVGAKLHIAVVTATVGGSNQPLLPGTRYSYNVVLLRAGGARADLPSLGLLVDRPSQPALGYQAGLLPSFATCPLAIDDLVLVHGSCNRIHGDGGPNLLFAVDELIEEVREDGQHRPHQLWMTGDQVYADDVAIALSPMLTVLGRDLLGVPELLPMPIGTGVIGVPVLQQNLPSGYRQHILFEAARLTSAESRSHLLGLTERLAMALHLWSPEVWARDAGGAVSLPDVTLMLGELKDPVLDAVEEPPPGMSAADAADARTWLRENQQAFGKEELAAVRTAARRERELVAAYAERVGRVRRALANVATYLVFDDHEVSDDWYLCQLWKDRVLGNGLGRSIVRDGLVTFALTQGWGNDPAAYQAGPGAELLAAVGQLFPAGVPTGPDPTAVATLDALLGTAGPSASPTMRWNYTVDGTVHRVVACDTRTRRGFTGPISPPLQLPDGERQEQIPAGPLPAGFEVLVVVLSQPAIDPVLLGELTQGLIARGAAARAGIAEKTDLDTVSAKAFAGLETLDYEGWGARPAEVALLLDRLATHRRVLILSGDVHFAVSLGMRFWRHGQGLVSEIGQFTSSAVQYVPFPEIVVPVLGQGWANDLAGRGYPVELLFWRNPANPPIAAPSLPARGLRRRLLGRPLLLPTRGWPADTTVEIPPDSAWSVDMLADTRPDSDRPDPVRPLPLPGEFDAADALRGPRGYGALARRHTAMVRRHPNTRRMGMFNKVAKVGFRHDEQGRLVARSELVSVDHKTPSTAPPEAFTLHELTYDTPVDTPEPTIGA